MEKNVITAEDRLIHLMLKGDPACPHQIGDKIKKIAGEEGDHHPIGSKGVVKGCMHTPQELIDNDPDISRDIYLVTFENTPEDTLVFINGNKLGKDE